MTAERTVFVLGDSLNDTGTFAPVTATGRFTTTPGLIWTEIVAAALGTVVAPAFFWTGERFVPNSGGTNYAQSGALVIGEEGLFDGASRSVAWQVDRLLEARSADLPDAIVVMDGGGPDIVLSALLAARGEIARDEALARVKAAGTALARQARRLIRAGAGRLVLMGVADFGAIPMFAAGGAETSSFVRSLSRGFNSALVRDAGRRDGPARIVDVLGFFDTVIAAPARFDLDNVTDPAVDPDRAPPSPTGNSANANPWHLVRPNAASRYLFADALHPSARGHALLAEFVMPELV